MLLDGFGISWYRSFRELQLIGPLGKVNLFAGTNNSGKSNILRFAHSQMFGPRITNPEGLDRHLDQTQEEPFGYAIAVHENSPILQPPKESSIPDILRRTDRFFKLDSFRLTSDELVWFYFIQERPDPTHRPTISREQAIRAAQEDRDTDVRNLAHAWLNISGGRSEDISIQFLEQVVRKLPSPTTAYVEAFRKITPAADETSPSSHSGARLLEALKELQNPNVDNDRGRKLAQFQALNRFAQTVLDDEQAQLEVQHDAKTLIVHQGGSVLPIEHFGTGVHQVVILAAAATTLENHLVCIEEPEIHLHPILQRKLIRYLSDNTTNQYLVATHSAQMLDHERAQVFSVRNQDRASLVSLAKEPQEISDVCRMLGYRPSDILQSNSIIWVEGPSDRIYISDWIRRSDPRLIEGIHFTIMFYGGRLLNHLTANDPEVTDFISLRRINRNMVVVIDSDKTTKDTRINATKRRVRDELESIEDDSFAWVTDGYTIENYLPPDVLKSAALVNHRRSTVDLLDLTSKYHNPLETSSGTRIDKVKLARAVADIWHGDSDTRAHLRRMIDRTVKVVQRANDL